jgi:type IV fimbrial biogenesis protein FimT
MSPACGATIHIPAVHPPICTFRRNGLVALTGPPKIRAMKIRSQGTTLIELMAAIAVLGVLIAIAMPGFRSLTASNRTIAATNDLVGALNLARSEALTRSVNAVVCTSSDQTTCSGSKDWADGWIVFSDRNRNGTVNNGELLQAWPAVGNGFKLSAETLDDNKSVDRVTYNSLGMGDLPPGTNRIRFQIVAPVCEGDKAGRTDVLLTGMIQTSKVACK